MKPKNAIQLFLVAFIWGIAFVAQSAAADLIRPFTFNAVRCMLGAITLLPLLLYRRKTSSDASAAALHKTSPADHSYWKTVVLGGLCCGLCLWGGSSLQQFGIAQTTVGKAGFITSLYIVFVPIAGALFLRKKVTLPIIGSVLLGLCGLFVLCIKEDLSISRGDFYVLIGSLAFTAHILVIDHFSTRVDGVVLSCLQFFVCSIICIPFMVFLEKPALSQLWAARTPILYAGIMSCGVAYTLQIIGQKHMNPTISSLILSMESVVSVLAGWLILSQKLTLREIWGCVIMFAAIILANLSDILSHRSTAA